VAHGGKTKYKQDLRCRCGAVGSVTWEEYETPPHHPGTTGYDYRKISSVDGPFRAEADSSIVCTNCGAEVM
jgi:hypothetical protein